MPSTCNLQILLFIGQMNELVLMTTQPWRVPNQKNCNLLQQARVQLHISSTEGVTVTFGSSAAKPQPRCSGGGCSRKVHFSGGGGRQAGLGRQKTDFPRLISRSRRPERWDGRHTPPPPPRCKFVSQVTVLLPCVRYRVVRALTFKIQGWEVKGTLTSTWICSDFQVQHRGLGCELSPAASACKDAWSRNLHLPFCASPCNVWRFGRERSLLPPYLGPATRLMRGEGREEGSLCTSQCNKRISRSRLRNSRRWMQDIQWWDLFFVRGLVNFLPAVA